MSPCRGLGKAQVNNFGGVLPRKACSHLHLVSDLQMPGPVIQKYAFCNDDTQTGEEELGWAGGMGPPAEMSTMPQHRGHQGDKSQVPPEECLIQQEFPTIDAKNKASGKT